MAIADAAWTFVGSSIEGEQFELGGINVWERPWALLPGQIAHVRDPLYGQEYAFAVYELTAEAKTVRFATGEFSNGVYGFYAPAVANERPQQDSAWYRLVQRAQSKKP